MAKILSEYEVGPLNAGVNISMLNTDIADDEVVALQDMWLDKPGQVYTRGNVQNLVNGNTAAYFGTSKKPRGMFSAVAPDGNTHTAVVSQDLSASALYLDLILDTGASIGSSVTIDVSPLASSDILVDAKPALGGGVWVGCQELLASASLRGQQYLFHWRGANKPNYTTGTLTVAQGSTSVVGVGTSWAANAAPGMFLTDTTGKKLIGVVKSVTSNTAIVLEAPATWAITGAAYNLLTIRSWGLEIAKGTIKTVGPTPGPASTTVIGAGTKFQAMGFAQYSLFRARDNAFIGQVSSVSGDEGLTLVSAATLTLDNEPFIARLTAGNPDPYFTYALPSTGTLPSYPGPLNATYAQLQWFARQDAPLVGTVAEVGTGDLHSRVWFSDPRNMNSVDLQTNDGDFIQIPSTVGLNLPIRGLAASTNALLVFKENETFAIFGTNPETFDPQKIWDDGALSSMSIIQYKGTVIWCGRNGVYMWDGKEVINLVKRSLGQRYSASMAYFDPRIHKICAVQYNDHFIFSVHTNGGSPPTLYTNMKNGTAVTTVSGQLATAAIYIPTRALCYLGGVFVIAGSKAGQGAWLLSASGPSVTGAVISDFNWLWSVSGGMDAYNGNNTTTPDPYLETKRYSCGDPLRLKQAKQIIMTYGTNTSDFRIEVCSGLGDSSLAGTWTRLANTFASTSNVPTTTRVKFHAKDRFIGLKMYDTLAFAGNGGSWILRRFELGFKWLSAGRV